MKRFVKEDGKVLVAFVVACAVFLVVTKGINYKQNHIHIQNEQTVQCTWVILPDFARTLKKYPHAKYVQLDFMSWRGEHCEISYDRPTQLLQLNDGRSVSGQVQVTEDHLMTAAVTTYSRYGYVLKTYYKHSDFEYSAEGISEMISKSEILKTQNEIEAYARQMGFDFFPVIYEMVDYDTMSAVAAYGGFPCYPHWSFDEF